MKKSKHTKDQWLIDTTKKAIEKSPKSTYVVSTSKKVIAYVKQGDETINDIDECEANLKLIASAPELLEACQIARNMLDDLPVPSLGGELTQQQNVRKNDLINGAKRVLEEALNGKKLNPFNPTNID